MSTPAFIVLSGGLCVVVAVGVVVFDFVLARREWTNYLSEPQTKSDDAMLEDTSSMTTEATGGQERVRTRADESRAGAEDDVREGDWALAGLIFGTRGSFPWWRIAAVALIVVGVGLQTLGAVMLDANQEHPHHRTSAVVAATHHHRHQHHHHRHHHAGSPLPGSPSPTS